MAAFSPMESMASNCKNESNEWDRLWLRCNSVYYGLIFVKGRETRETSVMIVSGLSIDVLICHDTIITFFVQCINFFIYVLAHTRGSLSCKYKYTLPPSNNYLYLCLS
jgi:hypothetical protein